MQLIDIFSFKKKIKLSFMALEMENWTSLHEVTGAEQCTQV